MFECPVCFEKTTDLTVSQGCKHLQHVKCMNQWIASGKNSCPVCRAVLVKRYTVGQRLYYLDPQAKILRVRVSHYEDAACYVVHGDAVLRASQPMLFAKFKDARRAKRLM